MQHRGRDVHTTTCLFATPTFSDLQTLWEPSDQHCFIIHTSVSSFILSALVTTTETRWGFISTLKLLFSTTKQKFTFSVSHSNIIGKMWSRIPHKIICKVDFWIFWIAQCLYSCLLASLAAFIFFLTTLVGSLCFFAHRCHWQSLSRMTLNCRHGALRRWLRSCSPFHVKFVLRSVRTHFSGSGPND